MLLKDLVTNDNFSLIFNNAYNSKEWYLLIKNDLPRMLRLWHGRREVYDYLLDPKDGLTPAALQDIRDLIDLSFMNNEWKYDHLYSIYKAEYNPIWNYDGSEKRTFQRDMTDNKSGKDTVTNSGKDSTEYLGSEKDTNSGSLQEARTTFDSDTDYDTNKTTDTRAVTKTFTGRKDELTHGKKAETDYNSGNTIHEETTEEMVRGGNQGTTTTQDMAEQELILAHKLQLLSTICLDIVEAICYI